MFNHTWGISIWRTARLAGAVDWPSPLYVFDHSAKYAGHSLRAGHATATAIAGASERSIMNQTGHRPVQMLRRYIRGGNLFRDNSVGKLWL